MPNIRILYENQVKRATIVASTTAGHLVATNLQNDIKSSVHRSVARTVIYTLDWQIAVNLNMVGLAFANLTSTATIRAQVFSVPSSPSPILDTGTVLACAYAPLGTFTWGTAPLGVNAFRFMGSSYGRVYFSQGATGRRLVVTVTDTDNPNPYVEAGCMVAGMYWEPECNPDWGAELAVLYGSKHEESEAGDLRTQRRPKRRAMDLHLSWLKSEADQLYMHEIAMQGNETPIWVSLFPEDANPIKEQRHQLLCKLDGDTRMAHPKYGQFSAPLSVLEI